LAVVFWFLNAFSKSYTTTIDFPVRYQNLPEGQVVLNDLPEYLQVEVEAFGFSLLRHFIGGPKDTIEIKGDYLQSKEDAKGNQYAYLSTRPMLGNIGEQLHSEIRIVKILTDSIPFFFDTKVTRLLPIQPKLDISFAPQFVQDGELQIVPTSARVTGPKRIMDTLQGLSTSKIVFENLKESQTATAKVMLADDKNVVCEPAEVLVTIPVIAFTETTIDVPISLVNVPDSLVMKLFPKTIKITCQVPFSKYDLLTTDRFLATVNYDDLTLGGSGKLRVRLENYPQFATIVRYKPERVEYIIKKQ